MRHRRLDVLVPDELLEAARRETARRMAEGERVSMADVVRHGLAELAGWPEVPPAPPSGWPKGRPRRRQAVAV